MIPEVIADTDKILTDLQNIEKGNNCQNLISDIISDVSADRQVLR